MSSPDAGEIAFEDDFSDWWLLLNNDAVIRTWGSVVQVDAGMVSFGGRRIGSGEFVEMCGVPIGALEAVVKGAGRNGIPLFSDQPQFDSSSHNWRSFLGK